MIPINIRDGLNIGQYSSHVRPQYLQESSSSCVILIDLRYSPEYKPPKIYTKKVLVCSFNANYSTEFNGNISKCSTPLDYKKTWSRSDNFSKNHYASYSGSSWCTGPDLSLIM